METISPRMPLSLDIKGKEFSCREAPSGDIGDSLFHNFLSRINEQDDDSGILAFLTKAASPDHPGPMVPAGKDDASGIQRLIDKGITLTAGGLSRLARFLENQGFPGREIKVLFESIADKKGNIPIDRLLAGLQGLMNGKTRITENLVLDQSDIPRLKETLFKMGLGAGQVRDVIERALNGDRRISLGRLTSALGAHFSDVRPETGRRLAEILQREMGIGFRAGDMEQAAKDAGLEEAVNRLTGSSSDAAREAARREIALLMLAKGIPAQDVKKFLESLAVRQSESHGGREYFLAQNAATSKKETNFLQRNSNTLVQIQKEGTGRQATWKERIIDILNREEFLAGRKAGTGTEAGQGNGSAKSIEILEEALWGRLQSKQTGINPTKIHTSENDNARETITKHDEIAKEAAKSGLKGLRARQSGGSATSRTMPTGEIIGSRLDQAEPSRQAASTVRGQAPAAPLPEPLPKIVDRMVWMVRRGEQISRIQISPPELGRMDLSIVIKQGHLHAHVSAENPMVKEIIEAGLQQLKQQLGNLGFTIERFDVSAGLDERRFAEFQARTGGQRNRPGRGKKLGEQVIMEVTPDRPNRNLMGELYRIDVRV